jgi:uncharacterized membrane protein YccC
VRTGAGLADEVAGFGFGAGALVVFGATRWDAVGVACLLVACVLVVCAADVRECDEVLGRACDALGRACDALSDAFAAWTLSGWQPAIPSTTANSSTPDAQALRCVFTATPRSGRMRPHGRYGRGRRL